MGAGVVVGDEVLELEDQAAGVTGVAELAEEFEAGGEVLGGESVADEDAGAQFFVEVFAEAEAGEFDFEVLVGTEPLLRTTLGFC